MNSTLGKVANGVVTVTLNGNEMASFDLEGRVLYYAIGAAAYRRSIYNEVYRLEWQGKEERIVEKLTDPNPVLARAYEVARSALRSSEDPALNRSLEIVAQRSPEWLLHDSEAATRLYERISIVPPDLYFSTYLQLTTGCSWNLCTFCNLYRDRRYSVKTAAEFAKHVRAVKRYLGRGVYARKSVFLGDANAMDVKQELLETALSDLAEELDRPPVYSFIDAFTTPKNLIRMDFRRLHSLGLKRVYLGLESGDPEVLRLLNKPLSIEKGEEFVHELKSSGINVGVILLIGAGGYRFWKDHVEMSSAVVKEMNLGRGDILYLSPLVEGEFYKGLATCMNMGTLSDREKEKQAREIQRGLRSSGKIEYPVVRYDIRESFVS